MKTGIHHGDTESTEKRIEMILFSGSVLSVTLWLFILSSHS